MLWVPLQGPALLCYPTARAVTVQCECMHVEFTLGPAAGWTWQQGKGWLMTGPGEKKYTGPYSPSALVTSNKTLTSEAMPYLFVPMDY